MINLDECNKIIAKYSKNIENKLNVTSTVQILKEILPSDNAEIDADDFASKYVDSIYLK